MKVLILFAVVAACQAAAVVYQYPVPYHGTASHFQSQDAAGNYAFSYGEGHPSGATYRHEAGDASGKKIGSYGLKEADGKVRIVDYIADAGGFRAKIKTNEEGVETKNPANVEISKAELQKVAVVAPYYYGYGHPFAYSGVAAPAYYPVY